MYLLKQKYSFDSSLFNFPSIYSICENFIYLLFFSFWIFRMILTGKNRKRRWRLKPLLGKRIPKRTIVWFPLLWTKMLFWLMRKKRMLSTNLNQIKPKFLLSLFLVRPLRISFLKAQFQLIEFKTMMMILILVI